MASPFQAGLPRRFLNSDKLMHSSVSIATQVELCGGKTDSSLMRCLFFPPLPLSGNETWQPGEEESRVEKGSVGDSFFIPSSTS